MQFHAHEFSSNFRLEELEDLVVEHFPFRVHFPSMKPNYVRPTIIEFDKEGVLIEYFFDRAYALLPLVFLIHHEIRGKQS